MAVAESEKQRFVFFDQSCDRYIRAVTSTHLFNEVKQQLSTGTPIIKLMRFNEVEYTPDGAVPTRHPGLFICQYQFLCCPARPPENLSKMQPATCTIHGATVARIPPLDTTVPAIDVATLSTAASTIFHEKMVGFQDRGDVRQLPELQFCTKTRRLCSCYGVSFKRCIVETVQVETLDLESIAATCYFVDREVTEMTCSSAP